MNPTFISSITIIISITNLYPYNYTTEYLRYNSIHIISDMDYAIENISAGRGGRGGWRGRGGYNNQRGQNNFQGSTYQQTYNQQPRTFNENYQNYNHNNFGNDQDNQRNRNNPQNYTNRNDQNNNYRGEQRNNSQSYDHQNSNRPRFNQNNNRNFQNNNGYNPNDFNNNDSIQQEYQQESQYPRNNRQFNYQNRNNNQSIIQTPNGMSLADSSYNGIDKNQSNGYNNFIEQTPNFRQQPLPQQQFNRGPRNNFNQNSYQQDQPSPASNNYSSNNYNNNRSFNDRRDRNFQRNGGYDNRRDRNFNDNSYQPVNRQMTEEELIVKLREKRDINIDNYKDIKIPNQCAVENSSTPYILPVKTANRGDPVDPTTIALLKGPRKMVPVNSPFEVRTFFSFPEMVGKGQVDREQVMGFRELTNVNFSDLQKRGNQLMKEILSSFERTFR